jgi:hypothetical protein
VGRGAALTHRVLMLALLLGFGLIEGRLAGRGTSVGPGRLFVRLHERAPARAAMDTT